MPAPYAMNATEMKLHASAGSPASFLSKLRYAAGMILGNQAEERARFFHELARLTGAGISVSRAAAVLDQPWRDGRARPALASLKDGLARGESISGALAPDLTRLEVSIVDAAERGGRLVDGFQHLEQYYHLLGQTFRRLRAAAIYPVLLLHVAVVLPTMVVAVLAGKKAGGVFWYVSAHLLVLWGVIALAVVAWRRLTRRSAVSLKADAFLRRLPVVGLAREALALARWSAVMHFQVISGQRLSDGLRRAGEATESAGLQYASSRAAEAIEGGGEMGPALTAQPAFPPELSSGLAAAEFTGSLDTETLQQSRQWMAEAGHRMEAAGRWVSGAFYGLVMLFTVIQIFRLIAGIVGIYGGYMKELGL